MRRIVRNDDDLRSDILARPVSTYENLFKTIASLPAGVAMPLRFGAEESAKAFLTYVRSCTSGGWVYSIRSGRRLDTVFLLSSKADPAAKVEDPAKPPRLADPVATFATKGDAQIYRLRMKQDGFQTRLVQRRRKLTVYVSTFEMLPFESIADLKRVGIL